MIADLISRNAQVAVLGVICLFATVQAQSSACLGATGDILSEAALGTASSVVTSAIQGSIGDSCDVATTGFSCTFNLATDTAEAVSDCKASNGAVFYYDLGASCTGSLTIGSTTGGIDLSNVFVCVDESVCTGSDVAAYAQSSAQTVLTFVGDAINTLAVFPITVSCDATITVKDDTGDILAAGPLGSATLAPTMAPTLTPVDGSARTVTSGASLQTMGYAFVFGFVSILAAF